MASNRSYYRNCCEVNEEDVVDVLKKVKGMKDVSLSGETGDCRIAALSQSRFREFPKKKLPVCAGAISP